MTGDRALWFVLLLTVAPGAVVLVVALVRGYSITVVFERRARRARQDDDGA